MNLAQTPVADPHLAEFEEKGFAGPFSLFSKEEMNTVLKNCSRYPRIMLPWEKGRHTVVQEMALTATHPVILEKIVATTGPDVLLWGSQIIRQPAAAKHRWHTDVEHICWPGVTVWLAAKNVISKESFGVITGSHRFSITPQELAAREGLDLRDDAALEKAAQRLDPSCRLQYLPVEDGQFVIFHGRLWHGTKNTTSCPRYSVIFQYTRPDSRVRIPRNNHYPDTAWYAAHPPCLLVHGRDVHRVNKTMRVNAIKTQKSYLTGLFYHLPANLLEKARRLIVP